MIKILRVTRFASGFFRCGALGPEAMKRIALHPVLAGLPFILETPNDDDGYIAEIHTVLSWLAE